MSDNRGECNVVRSDGAEIEAGISNLTAPRTRKELKNFVREHLGLRVPDVRLCEGHSSPMDYLWHAYSTDFPELRPPGQINGDCIVWANRSGGKTMLAAVVSLLEGLFKPHCQTRILGGSLDQSARMYEYLTEFVAEHFAEYADGPVRRSVCRFVNAARVRILAQSSREVRGQHVHKLRCDEVELFDPQVLRAANFITQSTQDLLGAMEVLSTMHRPYGIMQDLVDQAPTNSIPVFKWCMLEVMEHCPPERACSRCPLDWCCGGAARKAEGYMKIDDCITQMRRSSRAGFESEMLCMRPYLENAVFGEFDRAVHVAEVRYDPELPLYRAIDFGYVNPFVCLWIQTDAEGKVRVIDEYVQLKRVLKEHAAQIKRRTPGPVQATYCDPAGNSSSEQTGDSAAKVLKNNGIPAISHGSKILDGIEKIRCAIRAGDGQSRLVISPQCPKLIQAMQCYHYPESGKPTELPEKDGIYDHPIDALRYFFINHGRDRKVRERCY